MLNHEVKLSRLFQDFPISWLFPDFLGQLEPCPEALKNFFKKSPKGHAVVRRLYCEILYIKSGKNFGFWGPCSDGGKGCQYLRSATVSHDGVKRRSQSQRLLETAFQQRALLECVIVGGLTQVFTDMATLLLIACTLHTRTKHFQLQLTRPRTDKYSGVDLLNMGLWWRDDAVTHEWRGTAAPTEL